MPFYQNALGDRLEYELMFNDYSRVIQARANLNASYAINNISLEYDMVIQPELAHLNRRHYAGQMAYCMTGSFGTTRSAKTRATPCGTST